MRRSVLAVITIIVLAAAAAYGQRINSAEEFQQAMKTVGAAINSGTKAIGSGAYADAKAPLVLARQSLASSVPFWAEKKADNAVRLTKEAVQKLDDLDTSLSLKAVDNAAVSKAVSSLNDTCTACHDVYRTGDSKTGYRIKAGF